MKKKGQFFILAAVILSAIILSFGYTVNQARVNEEGDNFRDFTYEVKRETGAVFDYEIYNTVEGEKIDEFVELLSRDLKERDADANYIFLYGNLGDGENFDCINVLNSGDVDVYSSEGTIEGSGALGISNICEAGTCTSVETSYSDFNSDAGHGVICNCNLEEDCTLKSDHLEACCTDYCTDSQAGELCESNCEGRLEDEDYPFAVYLKNNFASCSDVLDCEGNCPALGAGEVVEVGITVSGQEMRFPFSNNNQVVFIVQKEVEDENFVAAA
jgi:hypothetical protein